MDQDKVGKLSLNELNKAMFQILDGGFNIVDMNAVDVREYIHIRLNHITKHFENDEMIRKDTYHELELCKEENFQENEYYKEFWKTGLNWGLPMCVDHLDNIQLYGNLESPNNRKNSSYVVYEVLKCTEETRLPGYPKCKSDQEIEDWLETKYAMIRFLDHKIDFTYGADPTRYGELWFPVVPLQSGFFTDSGYRYRYNEF